MPLTISRYHSFKPVDKPTAHIQTAGDSPTLAFSNRHHAKSHKKTSRKRTIRRQLVRQKNIAANHISLDHGSILIGVDEDGRGDGQQSPDAGHRDDSNAEPRPHFHVAAVDAAKKNKARTYFINRRSKNGSQFINTEQNERTTNGFSAFRCSFRHLSLPLPRLPDESVTLTSHATSPPRRD